MANENWLAALGQNIQFVAFWAHLGMTAIFIQLAFRYSIFGPEAIVTVIAAAALKEFWYDADYETNPVQTWQDNLQDFAGYVIGAFVGWALA